MKRAANRQKADKKWEAPKKCANAPAPALEKDPPPYDTPFVHVNRPEAQAAEAAQPTFIDGIIANLAINVPAQNLFILITPSKTHTDKCKFHIMDHVKKTYLVGAYLTNEQAREVQRTSCFKEYSVAVGSKAVGGYLDVNDQCMNGILQTLTGNFRNDGEVQKQEIPRLPKDRSRKEIERLQARQQRLKEQLKVKITTDIERKVDEMLAFSVRDHLKKMEEIANNAAEEEITEKKRKPKAAIQCEEAFSNKPRVQPEYLLQMEMDHYVKIINDPQRCTEKMLEDLFDMANRHKLHLCIRPDLGVRTQMQPDIEWTKPTAIYCVDFWKVSHLACVRLTQPEVMHLLRVRPEMLLRTTVIRDALEMTPFPRFWRNLLNKIATFFGMELLYDIFAENLFYLYQRKKTDIKK